MVEEVRSRWSSPPRDRGGSGQPVEARSPWSTSRADSAHVANHIAKGWRTPEALKRDSSVVVGEPRGVVEREDRR
jgi:hypothetical protein